MSASTSLPEVPDPAWLCGFSADLLLYQQEVLRVEAFLFICRGDCANSPPAWPTEVQAP